VIGHCGLSLVLRFLTDLALVSCQVFNLPSRHLLHWFQSAGEVDASIVKHVVVIGVALRIEQASCFTVIPGAVLLLGKLFAVLLCVIRHGVQVGPVGLFEDSAFLPINHLVLSSVVGCYGDGS